MLKLSSKIFITVFTWSGRAIEEPFPLKQVACYRDKENVQGFTNRWAPGFVNFVLACAYHFCLNMPAAFMQPGARLLVEPCTKVLSIYDLCFMVLWRQSP